jgi:hypothetical protein
MKEYWGSGGVVLHILDLGTRWEWSVSRPGRYTPSWMGPRAGLDTVVKREIPSTCRDWNPPIIQPIAQRCTAELSRLLYDENSSTIRRCRLVKLMN